MLLLTLLLAGFVDIGMDPVIDVDSNTILVKGHCYELNSEALVQTSVFYTTPGGSRENFLAKSDRVGDFNFELPDSTDALVFRSQGYGALALPVHVSGDPKGGEFEVRIPLVSVSTKRIAREWESNEPLASKADKKESIGIELFVNDLLNRVPIDAEVCITTTSGNERQCSEASSAVAPAVFNVNWYDSIHVTINAPGYDQFSASLYAGEENKTQKYQVGLIRPPNLLATNFNGAKESLLYCTMTDLETHSFFTSFNFSKKSGELGSFVNDVAPARYRLGVADAAQMRNNVATEALVAEELWLQPGLNLVTINIPEHTASPLTSDKRLLLPDRHWDSAVLSFEQSAYFLSDKAKVTLDSVLQYLTSGRLKPIKIVGHTDNVGRPDLNQLLSEHRAKVVSTYLKWGGLPDSLVRFYGLGGENPAASNETESGKARNRRVVIHFDND